jgi:lipoyl(octanoyl) transferase
MIFEHLHRIDYATALRQQEQLLEHCLQTGEERILLLEHDPVYTIGRLRDQSSLRDPKRLPHPVFETNRGGQATYHGPGQLVGYLILDLRVRGRDLHRYLREIETALIEIAGHYGVTARRNEGQTGVWVENRKLASIGVGVKKWITMHGFALNVASDLSGFTWITPCGIDGVRMTSLSLEIGHELDLAEVTQVTERILVSHFG